MYLFCCFVPGWESAGWVAAEEPGPGQDHEPGPWQAHRDRLTAREPRCSQSGPDSQVAGEQAPPAGGGPGARAGDGDPEGTRQAGEPAGRAPSGDHERGHARHLSAQRQQARSRAPGRPRAPGQDARVRERLVQTWRTGKLPIPLFCPKVSKPENKIIAKNKWWPRQSQLIWLQGKGYRF